MIWVLGGITLGIIVGYYIPITYTMNYSLYMSVMILAAMDLIFGAVKSSFEGTMII